MIAKRWGKRKIFASNGIKNNPKPKSSGMQCFPIRSQ